MKLDKWEAVKTTYGDLWDVRVRSKDGKLTRSIVRDLDETTAKTIAAAPENAEKVERYRDALEEIARTALEES